MHDVSLATHVDHRRQAERWGPGSDPLALHSQQRFLLLKPQIRAVPHEVPHRAFYGRRCRRGRRSGRALKYGAPGTDIKLRLPATSLPAVLRPLRTSVAAGLGGCLSS